MDVAGHNALALAAAAKALAAAPDPNFTVLSRDGVGRVVTYSVGVHNYTIHRDAANRVTSITSP